MKILVILLLFSSFSPSFSQEKASDFSEIDRKVKHIKAASPELLAKQLTEFCKSDREKVRSIFRWITENISYNVIIFNRRRKNADIFMHEEQDDTGTILKPLNERVAEKVLWKKIAFCDGYTRLFKTLCDYSGIRCEIITGYARTNMNRSGKFGVNHTWNAVWLDNNWHLLDVTWASGFISYADEFVRHYDDYYFLTPPQHFIRDHYPEDLQWTLLAEAPSFREYYQSPFRYSAFIKSGISSYFPAKGIIEAGVGDTILIELKIKSVPKNLFVTDTPVADTVLNVGLPAVIGAGGKISTIYTVLPGAKDWLHIYYNDEPVMRYKLNLRKSKDDLAVRAE